jgi:hypothetical protein
MNDVDRLLHLFATGALVRPRADERNLVDLARALGRLAGADLTLAPPAQALLDEIGGADHHVLVLIDGLGMNLIDRHATGFLRERVGRPIRTVFPSSTAPALTSLATGLWPGEHAVPAWWTYLPDRGVHATILPFVERFSERSLAELGIGSDEAFPQPSLRGRLTCETRAYLPSYIVRSTYSRYLAGGGENVGYEGLDRAVDAVVQRIAASRRPSFTYLYYAGVDTAAHEHGPESRAVAGRVALVEQELSRLVAGLAGRARVVVTADHGHIRIGESDRLVLAAEDELLALLVSPPAGEPRTPLFHCREGAREELARQFRARFGDRFLLLSTDEAEALHLFSPGRLDPEARRRLGDYVAISVDASVLLYAPAGSALAEMEGFHGGLLPDEMLVPLILA